MFKIKFLVMTCLMLFIMSCNEDELFVNSDIPHSSILDIDKNEFVVLGKKNNIAFDIENMQLAYESLKKNKTAKQWIKKTKNNRGSSFEYQITTTHKYYKFTPQDSLQYERLVNDSILAVSDIPFEYEIQTNGDKFQAPDMANTNFTHYYSVVPINHNIPTDIPHELISNMHFTPEDDIPDDAPELELQKVDFFHDLNTEALKISDNLKEEKEKLLYLYTNYQGIEEKLTWQEAQSRGLNLSQLVINFNEEDYDEPDFFERRRRWNPHGRITVTEDAINNQVVGVEGGDIRVRKWGFLVFRRARTNHNGNFITRSTRTKRVKYAIYFNDRPRFTIKAGTLFWNARHRGTRRYKRRGWYQNFTGGRSHFYALVQNAAYDYYHRIIYNYNLWRPHSRIKINAKYNRCVSSQTKPHWVPLSHIRITRKGKSCNYRGSDGIYATTVHELTHSAHLRHDGGMFSIFHLRDANRNLMQESWAEGVETIITNDRFNRLTNNNYHSSNPNDNNGRWNSWRQRVSINKMNKYTPIVEDLIDNTNQGQYNNQRPIDRVNGYNLNQIQTALNNCRSVECWEANLRNYYYNPTESNLQELFNYVQQVRNNSANWDRL